MEQTSSYCPECRQNTSGSCWQHGTSLLFTGPGAVPFMCPCCAGSGKVSRPPQVAGDVAHWVGSMSVTYACQACNGRGIVWGPPGVFE